MSEFLFKDAKTVSRAIQFLSSLVSRTGQNNLSEAKPTTGYVVIGATFREVKGDTTGRVEYDGPETARSSFEQQVKACAEANDKIHVDFNPK